jgi:hypothetical protein
VTFTRTERDGDDLVTVRYEADIELEVDITGLLSTVGRQAASSKGGKSVEDGGNIVAKRKGQPRRLQEVSRYKR